MKDPNGLQALAQGKSHMACQRLDSHFVGHKSLHKFLDKYLGTQSSELYSILWVAHHVATNIDHSQGVLAPPHQTTPGSRMSQYFDIIH